MDTLHDILQLTQNDERTMKVLQLLGDETRYKMFKLMQSQKEMCVSEIAAALDISASAVSQHFRFFELLGLVDRKRSGQKICYLLKANDPIIDQMKTITA